MSNKFLQRLLLLLVSSLCLLLANTEAQQQRLRLPQGYNMRLGSVPTRFVGKGAYTLAAQRGSGASKWQQTAQAQLSHQQQLQQQQQQQLQQRRQLFQWATMGGKKYI